MKLVTVRHRGPFDRYRVHLKRNVRVSYSTNQQDIGQVTDLDEMRSMLRVLRTGELISRLELFGEDSEGFTSHETLVDVLAERLLEARSKTVSFRLRRTPLRPRGSKQHIVVPVDVEGIGFSDFLLDSGSSGVLITAEMRNELGVSPLAGRFLNGVDSSGLTVRQKVQLPTLRLGHRELCLQEAIVTKLELREQVGGVLGLSFLKQVELDLDLDSDEGTLTFHPPGHVEQGVLDVSGMVKLDLNVVKGGLMVMTASLNDSPLMPAIVDISASYSVVNKHAARMAGIENGDGTDLGPYCHSPPVSVWLGKEPESSSSTATRLGSSEASARLHGDASLVSNTRGHGGAALVGSAPSPQQQLTVEALIEGPIPVREFPSLAPLGLADVPVMILGMDILCRSRAVFCFGSKAIYVQNPQVLYPSTSGLE